MHSVVRIALPLWFLIVAPASVQVTVRAETGLVTTPSSAVRLYERAINQGQCALASKFVGPGSMRLNTFLRQCRAVRHLSIAPLLDPGYRIHRLTAIYACLGYRAVVLLRDGSRRTNGGWYLLERTASAFWRIMLKQSHVVSGGVAIAPSRTTCAVAVPSYARASSARIITGSDFLSAHTGWIALSRSAAYVPNGSCDHGIGTNCDTAQTTLYRTDDAGRRWQRKLRLTTDAGPPIWVHFFNRRIGLVAASVGRLNPSTGTLSPATLLRTVDGGKRWVRLPLPTGIICTGCISFSDPMHGWVWIGDGAMGSMSVTVFRTIDGGRHWTRIACTMVAGFSRLCPVQSGIPFGGDKQFLTFVNRTDGWLTVSSNAGTPSLLWSADGGFVWRAQSVGLPPGVKPPSPKATVFPMGTFDAPHIFGQDGVLAETVSFYRPRLRTSRANLYLFRSHHAGKTWHFLERAPVPVPALGQYLDAHDWIFAASSTIWATRNGGRTWTHAAMHLPDGLELTELAYTDVRRGWAIAEPRGQSDGPDIGRTLLRTTDGGRTWQPLALPGE